LLKVCEAYKWASLSASFPCQPRVILEIVGRHSIPFHVCHIFVLDSDALMVNGQSLASIPQQPSPSMKTMIKVLIQLITGYWFSKATHIDVRRGNSSWSACY
jgi:hypothetical protein